MKKHLFFILFSIVSVLVNAQSTAETGNYYLNADRLKGKNLKTALHNIIVNHTVISYDGLWNAYKTTDLRSDGKIWDMYSNITNYDPDKDRAGSYKKEGDCFNREHSFPKSWFNDASPMVSDLMHIVPTDGYVNNRRSNYPFGETNGEDYKSNGGFCKLGSCKTSGYSGKVFEPSDEYKGDFARIYFYMVTCYEDRVANWSSDMLDKTKYPALKTWALNMLLRWAKEDPVSEKEINRNANVYKLQNNRNPFVDYPGLEQYIWGSYVDSTFSYNNYKQAVGDAGDGGNTGGNTGGDGGNDTIKTDTTKIDTVTVDVPEGKVKFKKINSAQELSIGEYFLIVSEQYKMALGEQNNNVRSNEKVAIEDDAITTEINKAGYPYALKLGGEKDAYTFFSVPDNGYLASPSSNNYLSVEGEVSKNSQWKISISSDNASILNSARAYTIYYNASSPRFAAYKSVQAPVVLYKRVGSETSAIDSVSSFSSNVIKVYSTTGVLLRQYKSLRDAISSLPHGIYIMNGRKMSL